MQRIVISESDLTSNVEIMSSYDVAYVPGFMYASDSELEKYYRTPTLFTNKYDFVAKVRASGTAPTFASDQMYPVFEQHTETVEGSDGFTKRAIPESGVMFTAGDVDLGYRIALYLLNMGIPVYYEVMNNTNKYDTAAIYYKYSKIDKSQTLFNSNVDYYKVKDEYISQSTVYVADSTITPVPVIAEAKKNDFITIVGADNDGTYSFTGVCTAGTPDTWVWKLNNTVVNLGPCLTIDSSFVPEYGREYEVTVVYEYATADEVVQKDIAPDTENSWFESVATGEMTDFDPNVTYYILTEDEVRPIEVPSMYAGLINRFSTTPSPSDASFDSVGDYSVKYITSGGYPTFEYCFKGSGSAFPLMSDMIACASRRGDAIALIDHTNNPTRDIYPSTLGGSGNAVIDIIRSVGQNIAHAEYAAMFTPWYECSHGAITSGATSYFVPGSVAYLSALAVQLRDYNPWLAVSGVTRGRVPNLASTNDALHTVSALTNNIADAYQVLPIDGRVPQVSINPITYIRNVGYCLWGNRTLRNNAVGTSALSFLNIRGIISDIKKVIYDACQNNLFEQNTDITWINFKSAITPLLDRMVSGYVLQDYSIVRYYIDPTSGDAVPSYKVLAIVRIQPINSIEVFDLTVQLENAEVIVAEE